MPSKARVNNQFCLCCVSKATRSTFTEYKSSFFRPNITSVINALLPLFSIFRCLTFAYTIMKILEANPLAERFI